MANAQAHVFMCRPASWGMEHGVYLEMYVLFPAQGRYMTHALEQVTLYPLHVHRREFDARGCH